MTSNPTEGLTGILGLAARIIDSLGEWGVGVLILAETVFPPIPSEIVLPFAGFLAAQGAMNFVLVLITSTLGSTAGALMLYWLGARLGLERSIRWLAKLPFLERQDIEAASRWFSRHGKSAIFFGRLIPGIRSLISLPAGAARMNLMTFSLFTLAGSGLWNALLLGAGVLLGAEYGLINEYSRLFNIAVYTAAALALISWLTVRARRAKKASK